jgi:hypothetical protein
MLSYGFFPLATPYPGGIKEISGNKVLENLIMNWT